ncbi:MAG TPA: ATP-binding protein [Longimicrobium sp.]|nr:ATP-binding protein [Longimicrobium sp.]
MTPGADRPHDRPAGAQDDRFGGTREGVAVLGPDWRIRYMNASMLEILRLIGDGAGAVETLWDALPGWERSEYADQLRHAMETGAGICFRVDGERGRGRVWEVHAEPLDSGDLRVRLRNVTAQARREAAETRHAQTGEALDAREARLSSIVSAAPVGIVLMDADTLVVREANAFYHQLLEGHWRIPGAIVGHTPADFIPDFVSAGIHDIFQGVARTGETFEIAEFEFNGFERGTIFFRWTLQGVGEREDGRPEYLLLLVVDVTSEVVGRRAAEAERRALYEVLDTLPMGVIVADAPSGRASFINRAGIALGGRPLEELSAPAVAEYADRWQTFRPTGEPFPPDELPIVRAVRGETARDVEIMLRLPDGAERTVVVTGVPLRDALGRVDRGLVVFYDLTDRLQLERALLERTRDAEDAAAEAAMRAEESRTLREIGRTLVSESEADRALELAARAAMELLGARAAAVAGPVEGGLLRVHPALGSLAELDGRTFAQGTTVSAELLAGGPARALNDLSELPAGTALHELHRVYGVRNVAVAPLRAFGVSMGVLAAIDRQGGFSAEDLRLLEGLADPAALALHNARALEGERRRAEENRALLAAAEALTSTLDAAEVMQRIATIARDLAHADGAALTVLAGEGDDERALVVAGLGVMEVLIGVSSPAPNSLTRMVVDAHHAAAVATAELPDLYAGTRGHLLRAGAAYLALVPVRAGDDDVGMLAVANSEGSGPFRAEQLRVVSLLADQAGLSVRNARLYQGAQAATRAQSEFLAMMSHELRTPLNALEGYAGLMEDGLFGPLTERQRDALRRMRVSRRHLMELIDSVLDLARVEAGTRRAEREEVDLRALVESVGEAMSGAAVSKKLSIEIDAAGAGTLCTDPGLLRQVLTNLLGNAIKFTERGGVVLRARMEGTGAVIEVDDTGPGIPREHQGRVFERFYQVDPSMTRREGGTGLGLALSREFVRLLGGELTLASEPGAGSRFRVVIPG